ncbi:MAG: glycerol-3-phosphate acyltransferase, partial [Firmicutes bacterium]|nr:glycerol-3-phosphate acyltransferase [Bacillota bacterium]
SGKDISRLGSGNVGAVNTLRQVGILPGLLTLILDVGKGALAVFWAVHFKEVTVFPLLALLLAIIGHNYSPFLKFKGGKGIATFVGGLLYLSPYTLVIFLLIFILLAWRLRDANTATGLGFLFLPFILGLQKGEWSWFFAGAAIALVIIVKHFPDFEAYSRRCS